MQHPASTLSTCVKTRRPFAAFFTLLVLAYGCWLIVFWPGVLGQDSLAILLEIQKPDSFHSGKPAFWYYFVRLFYQPTQLTEAPIAAIMVLCALIFARILAWCWAQRLQKTVWFAVVFICLAPHTVYFIGTLYPDGIYSVAVAGLMFEVWLGTRDRKLSPTALAMVALTLPFAAFARPNGFIFLLPVSILIFMVDRASRRWLGLVLLAWCVLVLVGSRMHKTSSHGAVYPLAIYETVNFLQPRPMNLWTAEPRLLAQTIETLQRHRPIENYLSHYDPDYWDPLQFKEDGPRVMTLPRQDQKTVVRDFFTYNLWHNFPDFLGSRVNIFFVAALAQGGLPGYEYSQYIIPQIETKSMYRLFQLQKAERVLMKSYSYSFTYRWLLWTPFLGIALLLWVFVEGLKRRNAALLIVSIPMGVQLGAIFIFSIAGEYRYLLPFFTVSIALLPVVAMHRTDPSPHSATI
ncbi:MAG: hypothetical protein ACK4OE_19390 [Acidovorax sp.]|uniref:hypothetical protein n=1 Tax=Acidovorax sp. TaxID=1872122 RepID=UPI003918EF09